MKVFIILATVAFVHGAKLERTYLPPSHAETSGGSGSFLQTPIAERAGRTNSGFPTNEAQGAPGFAQNGNGFAQNAPEFSQGGSDISNPGNVFAKTQEYNNENGFNNFGNFEARPERARAALERNAAILRQDNSNDGENYSYSYETENGIYAEESGVATNGVEAQGGFSYTGDDGQVYSIRYTADQNGFVPVGDHLPTPPPVPAEILKALEQNARDEAAGIYDDGSYNQARYAAVNNNYNGQSNNYNGQSDNYNGQSNNYNGQSNNYNGQSDNYNGQSDNYNGQSNNYNGQSNYQQQNALGNDEETLVINPAFSRSQNYQTQGLESPKVPSTGNSGSPISRGTLGSSRSLGLNDPSTGTGAEKAYLPPYTTQDRIGRRQNFESANGYQY